MSSVPKEKRTLDEWLSLITEARQSDLTDAEWCRRHDISRHTFCSAIKRLRRKSCAIPQGNSCVDLTTASGTVSAPKQDVVRVGVLGEDRCYALDQAAPPPSPSPFVDDAPIEISFGDACIRIANHADPMVVAGIVSSLRRRILQLFEQCIRTLLQGFRSGSEELAFFRHSKGSGCECICILCHPDGQSQ